MVWSNSKVVDVPFKEAQVEGILKRHDKNKDKRLSKAEVREAFEELGARHPRYRAWRGIAEADSDGDGFVSEDEMNKLIQYVLHLGYKVP